jgi:glycosyltransferase involved in cell wall biosynthesis
MFPGFVQGRLKDQLLSHASIYVQPSELEGLSIALIDAMSYARPCLVSNIPENVEAIGNAGITFENRNDKDLCLKLGELLANEPLCEKLAAAARDRAAQEYSWDRVTSELEHLYKVTLNK